MKLGSHMTKEHKAKLSVAHMGQIMSPETRAKLSEAMKGKTSWHKGIPTPIDVRAKLSASLKGRPKSFEMRARISATMTGRVISIETRARMSAAMKGRTISPEWRARLSVAHWKGGSKVSNRKQGAKHRLLGFNPLNSWFLGCEGHHINSRDVIYIPERLHESVKHNQYTGKGMDKMNALAGQFLTEDWT